MITPLVIDIFHLNPVTDFAAVVNSGIVGVIHKAYEAGVTDKLYAIRRKAFADAGLKCWGAYCFFHGSERKRTIFSPPPSRMQTRLSH